MSNFNCSFINLDLINELENLLVVKLPFKEGHWNILFILLEDPPYGNLIPPHHYVFKQPFRAYFCRVFFVVHLWIYSFIFIPVFFLWGRIWYNWTMPLYVLSIMSFWAYYQILHKRTKDCGKTILKFSYKKNEIKMRLNI